MEGKLKKRIEEEMKVIKVSWTQKKEGEDWVVKEISLDGIPFLQVLFPIVDEAKKEFPFAWKPLSIDTKYCSRNACFASDLDLWSWFCKWFGGDL